MGNSSGKSKYQQRAKKNVHWKTAEIPSVPGKPILASDNEFAPDVVTIQWDRPKSDGGSPIIGYLVEHRRTGSPHWVRATPTLLQYNILTLTGLEPGWRYQFRVFAENIVGRSEPSELSEALTVTLQRNAVTVPRFVMELQDTVAIENERVEFRVNVVGTPAPQINWYKDGFEIFSSRRTKIVNDSNTSVLIIHETALTDEGEIKCTATNRAGHVVTKSMLRLEAPPKIRLPRQYEDGLLIDADETIRLKVAVAGRPVPNVIWSHNGEVIQSNERYEIENTEKNSLLKIVNAKRSDRGEYYLKAQNKLGTDVASFLVTVTAKPSSPGKVNISMTLGKSVTLNWSAPDDDGGCKIGTYIVEYFRTGWDVWLKAATTRQLSTTLTDLIEGSEYRFRVKAENPFGLSDPSEESDIFFIPDAKRGLLKPNGKVAESSSTVNTMNKSNTQLRQVPKNVKLMSQIYDNDNEGIARDMAYGTPEFAFNKKKVSNEVALPVRPETPKLVTTSTTQTSNSKINLISRENSVPKIPLVKITSDAVTQTSVESQMQRLASDEGVKKLKPILKKKEESVDEGNEYFLVIYPEEKGNKSTDTRCQDALDYDDDSIPPPPPLSLSAPDLRDELPDVPVLKRSSSSTDLLYEKAMARLYKAIKNEESQQGSFIQQDSFESERISSPKIKRRLSFKDDVDLATTMQKPSLTRFRSDSTDDYPLMGSFDRMDNESFSDANYTPSSSMDYEDDYTASTASSEDSMEQFKSALFTHGLQTATELDTYHPVIKENLSPYRSPEPNLSSRELTKPSPLPDPDFVPKPILKRPQSPPMTKEIKTETKNGKENGKAKGLRQLFERRRSSESGNGVEKFKEKKENTTLNEKQIAAENLKKQKLERRQSSLEENKCMADHYNDLVREVGSRPRTPTLPQFGELKPSGSFDENEMEALRTKLSNLSGMEPDEKTEVSVTKEEVKINLHIHTFTPSKEEYIRNLERGSVSPVKEKSPELLEKRNFSPTRMTRGIACGNLNESTTVSPANTPVPEKANQPNLIQRSSMIHPSHPLSSDSTERDSGNTSSSMRNRRQGPRTRSQSNSGGNRKPLNRRTESRSPAALRRAQMAQNHNLKITTATIHLNGTQRTDSVSSLARSKTPEQMLEEAEVKVKFAFTYATDLVLFGIACWLYLFKDARLVIPILGLMVYRQVISVYKERIAKWKKKDEKPT